MAVYERFEDLPVWQEAARLYNLALDLLRAQNVRLGPGWKSQFERATLSVSSNIAEGFERLTSTELRSFLVIARGSAGEVRSMVGIVIRRPEGSPACGSPSGNPQHRRKLYQAVRSLDSID
jgi:four helix bundle protein